MKITGVLSDYELFEPGKPQANDVQVGGDHYRSKKIQPWDAIVAWDCGFLDGNVIKYVARYRAKGGVEDLKKARHYLDKLIEVESRNTTNGKKDTEEAARRSKILQGS
jgi:hypothetical protein